VIYKSVKTAHLSGLAEDARCSDWAMKPPTFLYRAADATRPTAGYDVRPVHGKYSIG